MLIRPGTDLGFRTNGLFPKLRLIGTVIGCLILPIQTHAGSDVPRTNPGGKYVHYGRTNPGGKYVYRGVGSKFHTNPGGKYVYPGYSSWRSLSR